MERSPAKIHVGAVYNDEPRNHTKVQTFVPIEKELVFDIDANDYDDVRFCACKGTPAVCSICWGLLENAMQILDSALRKDFGFKHIIWVFSGRRGVHGWVCDKKARSLTQEGRSSVASYLAVNNVQALKTLHPSLKRAYDKVLLPYFESMIGSNDLLMIEDANAKLFSLTKDTPAIEAQVRDSWNQDNVLTSDDRWREFKKILVDSKRFDLLHAIVFHFSYPRLDIQVSKQWNHLLKAPMTVHPSTGMVCVPITCREVSSRTGFDPTTTPRIHEVVQEVDLIVKSNGVDVATALRQTSLQRYLEILNEFVIGLSKERRQAKNAMQGVEDAF